MSKTYRKNIRIGVCTGSNTEYYRNRNRIQRRKNKLNLNHAVKQCEADDIEDTEFINLPKDHWDEPTDGSYTYNKREIDLKLEIEQNNYIKQFYNKLKRHFKK